MSKSDGSPTDKQGSAEPLRDEVMQWRGLKATPTAVPGDYIVVGNEMEKALIEETARRRRAEILLQAMNANYARDRPLYSDEQRKALNNLGERLRNAMNFIEEWANWWTTGLERPDDVKLTPKEEADAMKQAESIGERARNMVIENRRALANVPALGAPSAGVAPIDMLLFCPRCALQHVDSPEPEIGWTNPPHATHTCKGCSLNWRPSNALTNGAGSLPAAEEKHSERMKASDPLLYKPRSASERRDNTDILRAIVAGYLAWEVLGDSVNMVKAINEAEVRLQEIGGSAEVTVEPEPIDSSDSRGDR